MAEMKNATSCSHPRDRRKSTHDPDASTESGTPRIDSAVLLGADGRVVIEHRGQRYELRETRFGKLILTK